MLLKLSLLAVAASLWSLARASPIAEGDHAPAMVERAALLEDGMMPAAELMKRAPGPCEWSRLLTSSETGEHTDKRHDSSMVYGRAAGYVVKPNGDDWIYTEVGWPGAGALLSLSSEPLVPPNFAVRRES